MADEKKNWFSRIESLVGNHLRKRIANSRPREENDDEIVLKKMLYHVSNDLFSQMYEAVLVLAFCIHSHPLN